MSKKSEYIKDINKRDKIQTKEEQKMINKLNRLYKLSLKDVEGDLVKILDSYGKDADITYTAFLKTLPKEEQNNLKRSILSYLNYIKENDKDNKELISELNNLYKKSNLTRLDAILYELNKRINELGSTVKTSINNMLLSAITFVYKSVHDSLSNMYDIKRDYVAPTNKQLLEILNLKWSGITFSKRVDKNTKVLRASLRDYVTKMLITGKSVKITAKQYIEANKHLLNDFKKNYNKHKNRAITAVRTEYTYVSNQATRMVFEYFDVEEYEYLAFLDNRTSLVCREQDGNVYNLTEAKAGVNYPPLHPNCRSSVIPVM